MSRILEASVLSLQRGLLDAWRSLKFMLKALVYGGKAILLARASRPRLLRQFLEDMGSTYLKLGQYLAIRFDLLPKHMCEELSRLFENVRPVEFGKIRRQIERELGQSIETLFASFDPQCIAAASIAQVHKAVSHNSAVLAVKVQRPGVDRVIAADLRNLRRMAWIADAFKLTRNISLVKVLDAFAEYTLRELDFTAEGKTAELLRQSDSEVETPSVIWSLSSGRVLSMKFIEGQSLQRLSEKLADDPGWVAREMAGLNLTQSLSRLAAATLTQLFIKGYFHADPHPGNILVKREGGVALVDFGIFGRLTTEQRDALKGYVEHLLGGTIDESYLHYESLLSFSPNTDRIAFRHEVKETMRAWRRLLLDPYGDPAARHVGRIADRKAALLYKHHVQLDTNTLLFWRTLIVLDGTALRVLPDFDLAGILEQFFRAHRLSTKEHIYKALWNERRFRGTLDLVLHAPGAAVSVNRRSRDGSAVILVRRSDSRDKRKAANQCIRLLCLNIVVLAIWLCGGQYETVHPLIWSGAVTSVFVVSALRLATILRRHSS